jgi:zinc and cadmium transporter
MSAAPPSSELLNTLGALALVSLASLVGSVNYAFGKRLQVALPFLLSAAAGALLGTALFELLPEAWEHTGSVRNTAFWLTVGLLLSFGADRLLGLLLARSEAEDTHQLAAAVQKTVNPPAAAHHHHGSSTSRRALPSNVLIGGAIHSVVDGIGIAAAFTSSRRAGVATTLAVLLHEVPHHVADIGVLIYSGFSKRRAIGFNLLATSGCAAGGILVLLFGASTRILTAVLLPMTAANFLYVAVGVLMPELGGERQRRRAILQYAILVGTALAIYGLSRLLPET